MKILRHFWLLVSSTLALLILTGALGGSSALAAPAQSASSPHMAAPRSTHISPITYHVTPKVYHVTPVVHQVTPQKRGTFTMYTVPGNDPAPFGMTVGPDNGYWFDSTALVDRSSAKGKIVEYTAPVYGGLDIIIAGPQNRMWFTEPNDYIGSVTTS